MTIDKYIKEFRTRIIDNQPYDEYKKMIFEYIEFLESALSENPGNIEAVCQLAIAYMEAREPAERSIELMEGALKNSSDISVDESVELLNNLAFLYAEEMCDTVKSKQLLEEAVKINSRFPNPFNALGVLYLSENNIVDALVMFEKAVFLSKENKYRNNYAAALFEALQTEQALDIFHEIFKEWRNDKVAASAYYSYGMIESINGDAAAGLEVAGNLCSILDSDAGIDAWKIAELYFVNKEFEKCVELYDYEKLYPSIDWLKIYFYSLYKLNSKEKLERSFNDSIVKKEGLILEVQNDNDEYWTDEERKSFIEDCNKDIRDLTDLYNSIINKGYEPEMNFKPDFIYGCYLIHCPRHWD